MLAGIITTNKKIQSQNLSSGNFVLAMDPSAKMIPTN